LRCGVHTGNTTVEKKIGPTMKVYVKTFTSEIDIQHKVDYFLEFKKTSPFTLNTAVIVSNLK